MTVSDDHVERDARASLTAFIVRARRVEEHSLASDRAALADLARMKFKLEIEPSTGKATWIQEFPPEEQVESAAARVRPLILDQDPTHYARAFKALGYLLHAAGASELVMKNLKGLKAEWAAIKPKGEHVRGYSVEVSLAGSQDAELLADNVLGFAWMYGDVVHGDAERLAETHTFGVVERFRAAVPLVAHIMILTIATLNFIRAVQQAGLVTIEDGLFDSQVVVKETTFRKEAQVYLGELDAAGQPVAVPRLGQEPGEDWTPIHQVLGPAGSPSANHTGTGL